MTWTRLWLVLPLLAACGDDKADDGSAGDTPAITSLPMTMTNPVTTGTPEETGGETGGSSDGG